MRVAFLGKIGAGKTATAAGFVKYAAQKHPLVLAIDADADAQLAQALSFETPARELASVFDEVSQYLRGDRTDLLGRPMIATTPPTLQSNFIRVSTQDSFIRKYALRDGTIALLTIGSYKESDAESSRYHTRLAAVAAVLHHLLDTEFDIIVSDTMAGTDTITTSLKFVYDLIVFVVEPTEKSIKQYADFLALAPHLADRTFVVANKVDVKDDELFVKSAIPGEKILGFVPYSRNLKRFEQGHKHAIKEFEREQLEVFDAVYAKLLSRTRDWTKYLKNLRELHETACREWYNQFYNMELNKGLDADFDYDRAQQLKPALFKRVSKTIF